jgi:hypothetical protein
MADKRARRGARPRRPRGPGERRLRRDPSGATRIQGPALGLAGFAAGMSLLGAASPIGSIRQLP